MDSFFSKHQKYDNSSLNQRTTENHIIIIIIFLKPWYSYHSENVITYIISWCLSSSQFFGCEVFREVFKKDVKWGTNTKDTVSVNMTRSDCHLFSFPLSLQHRNCCKHLQSLHINNLYLGLGLFVFCKNWLNDWSDQSDDFFFK